MNKIGITIFALVIFIQAASAFKVLAFLPFFATSHNKIGTSIARSLADKNHEVTVVTCFPSKEENKNFKEISTEDFLESFFKGNVANMFDFESTPLISPLMELHAIKGMGEAMTRPYLAHPKIKELLKSNEKFDVCLMEVFNYDALNYGFADHFGCIIVAYSIWPAVKWQDDITGNISPLSFIPKPYLKYTDNMNFIERLHNTVMSHFEDLHYHLVTKRTQRNLYQELFPNAKKSFDEMYRSPAIIFLNSHVASLSPRPYMPNMVEIGGIHIEPAKEIPKEIKEFLDSAKDGVVYFSMGSVLKSVQWPAEKLQEILKALGKLKQKVIWKYEDPSLPNKPNNVMINPWLPQRDIFTHPNVKVFITHGGLLGTAEALVEGIPLLGLPIFGDQKMNIAYAVDGGYAEQIFFPNITEQTITQALQKLLTNPKYRENAKIASERYKDRPMSAKDAVVYWTEYAVKHNGAPHLRSFPATNLNYFQARSLDVYLLIGVVLILAIKIKLFIVRAVLGMCFKSGGDKKKKEKYKSLNIQYLDDLNSCDDLQLKYASSLIEYNKFQFVDFDEEAVWHYVDYFYVMVADTFEKEKQGINEAVKNFTELLAKNEIISLRNELHALLKKFSSYQQQEIQKQINACDCPSKVSSSNLTAVIEEYQKMLAEISLSERTKEHFNDLRRSKMEEVKNNITTEEIQKILGRIMHCDSGYPDHYLSNSSFWSVKNNSCSNFQMDLANQEAKIWRNKKVIDVLMDDGLPCIANGLKALVDRINNLKGIEKNATSEFVEVLRKYKEVFNDHMNILQEYSRKRVKMHENMKQIHDENCKCKK